MEEKKLTLPEFPELYTPTDAERLASLQDQSDKLKELYYSHFHDPVWESKPWLEKLGRKMLDPPRQHLPGLDRLIPHMLPSTAREERYRIEEEIKALDKLRYAQERSPQIMDEMMALAIGGNFIEDATKFYQLFPDARRFPDEMKDYLMNFGVILAKSDPEDIKSGDFWNIIAPGTEASYRDYWKDKELSPEHVLSSIAFSQNTEEIRQALMYAFPPSEHLAIPEDQMGEEWYKNLEELLRNYNVNFDRENPETSLEMFSLIKLYNDGVPKTLISEDGTPLLDENGEPVQARLYPGLGDTPATVWLDDELLGVYDEERGEFVPWNFATGQPYSSVEDQEDIHVVRSTFNNIINRTVDMALGIGVTTPMFLSGMFAVISEGIASLGKPSSYLDGAYIDPLVEKLGVTREEFDKQVENIEEVYQNSPEARFHRWQDDRTEEIVIWGTGLSIKVHDATKDWREENKLPVMPEYEQVAFMDKKAEVGLEGILKDTDYMAHLLTESVSSMALTMGTMIGVSALTKNPALGKLVSAYVIGSAETSRVIEMLREEGIDETEIAKWTAVLVPALGALEVAGASVMLRAIAPKVYKELMGGVIKELVRGTRRELLRRGMQSFTVTQLTEVLVEVAVQATGNAVLHHEGVIDSVTEGLDEVAYRTFFSFLIPSGYGGFSHTHYLHQNFVEAGLYDTHMARVAQLESVGMTNEMANVMSALELIETTEGAKAKTKTYRQLEPVFRQAAQSGELIQSIHEVESQFSQLFTKEQALSEQITLQEKAISHHERVLARTIDPAKIERRTASLEQARALEAQLRADREGLSAEKETLVKHLAYLDNLALMSGQMTMRVWDTRPPDAKKIYLEELGIVGKEGVGTEYAEMAWEQLPLEIRMALESHESKSMAEFLQTLDTSTLSGDQVQQVEALQQKQRELNELYEPLAKELYDKQRDWEWKSKNWRVKYSSVKERDSALDRLAGEMIRLKAQMTPIQKEIFALQQQVRDIAQRLPVTPLEEIKLTHAQDGEMSLADKNRVTHLLQTVQETVRFDIREIQIDADLPTPGAIDPVTGQREMFLGRWAEDTRTMYLRPDFTDNTFYHEVAHAISTMDVNEGRFEFWKAYSPDFAAKMQRKIRELQRLGRPITTPLGGMADLLYSQWQTYRNLEESYARAFAAYFEQRTRFQTEGRETADLVAFEKVFAQYFNLGRMLQQDNLARNIIKVNESITQRENNIKLIQAIIEGHEQSIKKGRLLTPESIRDTELAIAQLKYDEADQKRFLNIFQEEKAALEIKQAQLDQGNAPPPSDAPPTSITSPEQFPTDPSTGLAKLPSLEAILAQRTLHLKRNPDLAAKVTIPIDVNLLDDKSLSYEHMSTIPGFRKWFKGHLDTKYILMNLEARTGKPFYTLYDLMRQVHGQIEHSSRLILEKISKVPDFQQVINNPEMLARVEQLIASRNPKFKVAVPQNLIHLEQNFAKVVEEIFQSYRPKINVLAFSKAYEANPGNVDAIMKMMLLDESHRPTVEKAVTMTRRGETASRDAYIMNLDWGVIEGYTPWMVVVQGLNRSSQEYSSKRRGEGRLKHRFGVEIPDMSNSLTERIEQYVRQIESQWQLKGLLDTFETYLGEVSDKMSDSGQMYDEMSRFIQELQHFPPPESQAGGNKFIQRVYATVSPALFHTNARVLLRNFTQFLAFHPERSWLPKGIRARKIVDQGLYQKSLLYYKATVSQMTGIQRSIFFHGTKPLYADWFMIGKPLYNLTRLLNRVAPYGRSDDVPRHWSFNTGMVRAHEAIQAYRKHGDVNRLLRDAGMDVLKKPQQDLFLQYVAIGENYVNMGIEGLQQVTGYEAAALYRGKEVADLTHFNYERAFRAPIEQGAAGRTWFNLLTFTRSYWTRHYNNFLKWSGKDWAETYTPRQRLAAFKDSIAMIAMGGIISSYLRELYGRPYRSYWIGDIMYWEMGGLIIGAVNQLGGGFQAMATALDPTTEEDERWRAVRAVTKFFLSEAPKLFIPFATNLLESLEAGAMRGHLPEGVVDYDLRAYQAIRSAFDDKYTPSEIEVLEIELMDAILKGVFATPPPELDRVVEAVNYLNERKGELGVVYTDKPGKVGQIYEMGNFLSDVDSYIRNQNIPRDMVTADVGFEPLVEFALDFLYLLDEFYEIPTSPAKLRNDWRKDNPEFELLLIFWERYTVSKVSYGSPAGRQIEEALGALDRSFGIPAQAARSRLNNWRYAIIP